MKRGCAWSLLCILGAFAFLGLLYGLDAFVLAPWAHGVLGRPTLTGDWTGPVTTHEGTRFEIYLHVDYVEARGHNIEGKAAWCAHGLPVTRGTLQGAADRTASDVTLFSLPDPPRAGLSPYRYRGAWQGSALVLHVVFDRYENRAGAVWLVGDNSPDETRPVPATLHKAAYATFAAACSRI